MTVIEMRAMEILISSLPSLVEAIEKQNTLLQEQNELIKQLIKEKEDKQVFFFIYTSNNNVYTSTLNCKIGQM